LVSGGYGPGEVVGFRTSVLAAVLLAALHATASGAMPTADPTLKQYLGRMGVQMHAYRAALARADRTFTLASPKAATAAFKARSAEFAKVVAHIKPIRPPRSLRASHPGIVRAITIVATAFKGFATAQEHWRKNHNRTALINANTVQHERLRTAQSLEVAWARAVRDRVLKAGLVAPRWLRDFF
jgi:hypothetical protein